MLEDTNSLDGAHINIIVRLRSQKYHRKDYNIPIKKICRTQLLLMSVKLSN